MNGRQALQRIGFHLGLTAVFLVCCAFAGAAENQSAPAAPTSDYPADLSQEELYKYANDFYLDNKPEKALEGYKALYSQGVRNGYLFYNLGNALFRLGNLGESILWYERALEYLPRFHDLRVNYEYARGLLADEEFRAPEYGGTLGFLLGVHGRINLRECLIVTTILFWALAALFVVRLLVPPLAKSSLTSIPCWIVGIAFILFCLSSALKIVRYETVTDAIILAPAVEIKTGPGDDFSTSFSLHEGTKVRIEQEQGEWARIVLPSNTSFTGWAPSSTMESI